MSIPKRPDADDLVRLRFLAAEFDREADGGCWPASRFVEWVELGLNDHGSDVRREIVQARGQAEANGH